MNRITCELHYLRGTAIRGLLLDPSLNDQLRAYVDASWDESQKQGDVAVLPF